MFTKLCQHLQISVFLFFLLFMQYFTHKSRFVQQLWSFHTRARQRQDEDKTNVEPVHSYDAFHTRSDKPCVKGIIGMHRFNICFVVILLLSCSGVKTPLGLVLSPRHLVDIPYSCSDSVLFRSRFIWVGVSKCACSSYPKFPTLILYMKFKG